MHWYRKKKEKFNAKARDAWLYINKNILTTTKRQIVALLVVVLSLNAVLSFALIHASFNKTQWQGVPEEVVKQAQENGTGVAEFVYYASGKSPSGQKRKSSQHTYSPDGGTTGKKSSDGYVHVYTFGDMDTLYANITAEMGKKARAFKSSGGKANIYYTRLWDKDGNASKFTYSDPGEAEDGKIGVGKRSTIRKETTDNNAIAQVSRNAQKDGDYKTDLSGKISKDMAEATEEEDDNRSKVEKIIESLLDWALEKATGLLEVGFGEIGKFQVEDSNTGLFESILGHVKANDKSGFETYSLLSVFAVALSYAGIALLIFIAIFSIIVAIMSPSSNETPFQILGGTAIATVLTLNAHSFSMIFIKLAHAIQEMFKFGAQSFGSTKGWSDIVSSAHGKDGVVTTIIQLIMTIIVIKEILKLMLEIVERYGVYKLFYYTSPVFCATAASGSTRGVFTTWLKTFISHLFIMIMNLWVVGLAAGLLAKAPKAEIDKNGNAGWLLYILFVLMIIKIGQRLDDYLGSMGLSVARTGGNLAGAAIGAIAMGRTAVGLARAGGKVAMKAGKAGVTGGKNIATGETGNKFAKAGSFMSGALNGENAAKKAMARHNAANPGQAYTKAGATLGASLATKTPLAGDAAKDMVRNQMLNPALASKAKGSALHAAATDPNSNLRLGAATFDGKGSGYIPVTDRNGNSMGGYKLSREAGKGSIDMGHGLYATPDGPIGGPNENLKALGAKTTIADAPNAAGSMTFGGNSVADHINSQHSDAGLSNNDTIMRTDNGYVIQDSESGEIKGALFEGKREGLDSFMDDRGMEYTYAANDGTMEVQKIGEGEKETIFQNGEKIEATTEWNEETAIRDAAAHKDKMDHVDMVHDSPFRDDQGEAFAHKNYVDKIHE